MSDILPNVDLAAPWSFSSLPDHYESINGDDASFIQANANDDFETEEFDCTTFTLTDNEYITELTLYVKAKYTGGVQNINAQMYYDGSYQSPTIASELTASYVTYEVTHSNLRLDQTDLDAIKFRITTEAIGVGETIEVIFAKIVAVRQIIISGDEIISAVITQRRGGHAIAEFTLIEDATVTFDELVEITGEYTTQNVTSTEVIFTGILSEYSFDAQKKCQAISKQDEITRVKPEGYYQGMTGIWLSDMTKDHGDFINFDSGDYGGTWTGYFDAPYNFSTQTGRSGTDIDFVDGSGGTETGTLSLTIEDVIDGHNKVLYIYNNNISKYFYHNLGRESTYGTVEFWYRTTNATISHYLQLYQNIANAIDILIDNNKISDGKGNIAISDNVWYIIRIDYECTTDGYKSLSQYYYKLSVYDSNGDLVVSGTNPYTGAFDISRNFLTQFAVATQDNYCNIYIDAYGETFDEAYNEGDNVDEIVYNLPIGNVSSMHKTDASQTLQGWYELGTKAEKLTWALAPKGDVRMHDGTEDSGVVYNITDQEEYWNCSASRQNKRINKVILKGAYPLVAYAEIEERQEGSTGIIVFKDFAPSITDFDTLQVMANNLLDINKDPPLEIQVSLIDSVHGFIQPGEFITVAADTWLWNDSGDYVPTGTYIIDEICYYIEDGVYDHIDLILQDVLQFTEDPPTDDKIDKNTQANKADYIVTGVGGNGVGIHPMDSPTYHSISDITTLDATSTEHGLLPKLSNIVTEYLDGQGGWTKPGGGGDTDAVHVNVANEITGIAQKGTPVDADEFVIEDSEASFVKKSIQLVTLPFLKKAGGTISGNLAVQGITTVNGIVPDDDLTETCGSDTLTWMRVYTRDLYDAAGNQILGTDSSGNIDQIAPLTTNISTNKGITYELTAAVSLVNGDLCYMNDVGKMAKAQANLETTCDTLLAMCMDTISADASGTFLVFGLYTTSGLSQGIEYWVSDITAGALISTRPDTSGDIVRHVGTSLSTTVLFFNPSHSYVEVV